MLIAKWDSEIEDLEFIETEGGIDEWRRLIGCEKIDIVEVTIEGVLFDVIYDAKAWEKESKASAVISGETDGFPTKAYLLGNLIFCHHNENQLSAGLEYGDEDLLASSVYVTFGNDEDEEYAFMALNKVRRIEL